MLYLKLSHIRDMVKLPVGLNDKVKASVREFLQVLDNEYGEHRGIHDDGGYVVLCDGHDVEEARACVDYTEHPPEWVNVINGDVAWCSALYLLNNEYAIVLVMPLEAAPVEIVREIDEFS